MAHFVIMGCGRVGVSLAHTLDSAGHSVAVIDQDPHAFRRLSKGFSGSTVTGMGFDKDTLEAAKIDEAYAFAAVSSGDNSNILATRVSRETYNVPHVVARIYDPGRAEIYQRLGIPTVAAVRWSTDQVLRRILPDYSMRGDFREPSGRLVLSEVALHRDWYGRLVKELEAAAGVRVAYLTRFGEGTIPESRTRLQGGDLVHVMMRLDESKDIEKILASPPAAQANE
ncbi:MULTISPECIES: TrkA family potassium uptake protein [Micrococcaceae]|uniref:potassium channel family protein n=1 Tax=Micrococcaceae TaxID=1268 RepID=UPI000FB0BC3F|nr:TrkA family potassium uptake protein [Arthrobacter sp. JUb115]MCS3491474.1 trk system potassium uptake protein TrkA [Arthrobacter sp. JUb119]TDU25424.1 trk system potassium uptake protein TrkA [Arthrobacter sp. JUb115]